MANLKPNRNNDTSKSTTSRRMADKNFMTKLNRGNKPTQPKK